MSIAHISDIQSLIFMVKRYRSIIITAIIQCIFHLLQIIIQIQIITKIYKKTIKNMHKDNDTLTTLRKYKQFLASHKCPQNLPDYDQESYWDARYQLQQQENYDWYVQWHEIRDLFMQFVSTNMRILQLGSGKSNILREMYREGYRNIIGSDFSWTLINQKKNQERYIKSGVRWERIDVLKQWMDFDTDCIFQKATIDCLSLVEARRAFEHIYAILKEGGIFFHVTTAPPEIRISMLKKWDVKVYQLPKTIIPMFSEIDKARAYYMYICCK